MAEQFDIAKEISEITDPKALRVITYLLEEIRVLKEKVACLEKNSSTSSKPPSSDIVKPEHEQRRPGERKAGGQPHHKAKSRELLPPEEVGRTEELQIQECPKCGSKVEARDKVFIQQIVELRERLIEVTQYNRHSGWCPCCDKLRYASLPLGVAEGQAYGPRLQALLGYMKGNLGASYTETVPYFV